MSQEPASLSLIGTLSTLDHPQCICIYTSPVQTQVTSITHTNLLDPTLQEDQEQDRPFDYSDVPIFTDESLKALAERRPQSQITKEEEGSGSSKRKPKKKQKPLTPGSTADYKRKEANRLAAERSRNRQNEKRASLNAAAQRLREEQARLRAEIAKLENEDGQGEGEGIGQHIERTNEFLLSHHNPHNEPSKQLDNQETEADVTGSGASVGGDQLNNTHGPTGAGMTSEAMEAEAEAQAHSRTILAALMSDAEIDQALVGQWMEQVGHGDQEAGPSSNNGQGQGTNDSQAEATLEPQSQTEVAIQSEPGPLTRTQIQTRAPSSTRDDDDSAPDEVIKPNGLAVALHSEMERYLREDLAATKIAIDQIDKEFAILRGDLKRPTEEDGTEKEYISPLPADACSTDRNILSTIVNTIEEEARRTGDSLPGLKETLIDLKESRIGEAERLKTLLSNLSISDEDRVIVDKLLKPLSAHLDELLMGLAPEVSTFLFHACRKLIGQKADALHAILGSSIAPAIAPRRRGRPPRHPAIAKIRAPRSRKTKLAAMVANGDSVEAEPTQDQDDQDQGEGGDGSHGHGDGGIDVDGEGPVNVDPRLDDIHEQVPQQPSDLELHNLSETQGEMTTEELISQLANHDDQDLRDLLSSHAENEYAAQQAISAHLQSQLDQQPNPLDTPTQHHHHQTLGHDHGYEHGHGEGSNPNNHGHVVNFKQGPPGSCDICTRTQTTVWRKLHVNGEDLHVCNRTSPSPLMMMSSDKKHVGCIILKRVKSAHRNYGVMGN